MFRFTTENEKQLQIQAIGLYVLYEDMNATDLGAVSTLPFSCPFGAPKGSKRQQTATQSEARNRLVFIGWSAQFGKLSQRAAKGG
jgi:hypothetical protein